VDAIRSNQSLSPETVSHGGAIDKSWENAHEWTPVPLQPGDMLLFGSHLAHRSAPNKTASSRNSIYATYHGKKDGLDLRKRYYADRRANFPPDHDRDPTKDYGEGWKGYAFAAPFTRTKEEFLGGVRATGEVAV
jgi:2-aminoethylphosphonate dioxygenase